MNSKQRLIASRAHGTWQDFGLPGLSRSLLCSLIFHASVLFWITEMPQGQQNAQYFGSQLLQIDLPSPRKIDPAPPQPERKSPVAPLPPDPKALSAAEEVTSFSLPLPVASEQIYIAPEDVEEMAFVVDVGELPLPNSEGTPDGTLYLKVLISESGSADRIDIVKSTLPDDYAATLINSFYQARFSPARMAGLPVRSWRIIEIRFGDSEPASS